MQEKNITYMEGEEESRRQRRKEGAEVGSMCRIIEEWGQNVDVISNRIPKGARASVQFDTSNYFLSFLKIYSNFFFHNQLY